MATFTVFSNWRQPSSAERLKMFKRPVLLSNKNVLFNIKSIKLKHEWRAPEGYDTGIKVYCRANKKKVPLIFPNKNFIKWYICGPTVYDSSHIGHASCYIRFDIINRILREFFDIKPVIALGVTDIDDKIITRASQRSMDPRKLAKEYELEFFSQMNALNILPPSFVLRVTEHIPTIIDFISQIVDKGNAYRVEDGSVYFSMPEPEEDSPHDEDLPALKPGQKSRADFALWKGVKPGEPYWESPWGRGRPGWHIECSAMASKIFGAQLDLHGGGIDLAFPHHANEEKQSCSYHGCSQWVNYWLHTGELLVENEKMSKSLKNFTSISDFLKSYTADTLRMYCFISKYQRGLHYGPDAMTLPATLCDIISKFIADSTAYIKGTSSYGNIPESDLLQQLEETSRKVREHLMEDFDTGLCHITLMELIRTTTTMMNKPADGSSSRSPAAVAAVSQYVQDVFRSFGFQLGAGEASLAFQDEGRLEFVLNHVVNFRNEVRVEALASQEKTVKRNLLSACDALRKEFETVGIVIKDQGKDKSMWSVVNRQKSADVN